MHHAAHATAAQQASAIKQARFEHDLHTKQLAQFHSALGDGLLFGMVRLSASSVRLGTTKLPGKSELRFTHVPICHGCMSCDD